MSLFADSALLETVVALAKPALFNVYFALASIPVGFPFALGLAVGKNSRIKPLAWLCQSYIYAFRGSPLFIQFFMVYSVMLAFNLSTWKPMGIDHIVLHPLFLGPLVLVLNTAAYGAEIISGALRSVPRGQVEAALAVGMSRWQVFRSVTWPNAIRLAWPAYTNEVVFLFHATALVYFTLPVINDQQDLMNKAGELFETDYNVFLHYSVAAGYFLVISAVIFWLASLVYKRMNRHMDTGARMKMRPNYMR